MSEYIEREALRKILIEHFDADFDSDGKLMYSDHICTGEDCEDLLKLVDKIPVADVAEVVRCKKCRHYDYANKTCMRMSVEPEAYGEGIYINMPEDGHCNYGERREE